MMGDRAGVIFAAQGCGERLKPVAGDCWVFCFYGSVPCPPIQAAALDDRMLPALSMPNRG
jgi:hypothetical protein